MAETIRRIEALDPDSLTVHSLAVKRASRLQQWIEQNGFSALNNTDESMRIAAEGAARMDMVPYYLYRQKNMSGNFRRICPATLRTWDMPGKANTGSTTF